MTNIKSEVHTYFLSYSHFFLKKVLDMDTPNLMPKRFEIFYSGFCYTLTLSFPILMK